MNKRNKFLKILPALFILSGSFFNAFAQSSSGNLTIDLQPEKKIWSGDIIEGDKRALSDSYHFDFDTNNNSGQLQSLLTKNQVGSEQPDKFAPTGRQLYSELTGGNAPDIENLSLSVAVKDADYIFQGTGPVSFDVSVTNNNKKSIKAIVHFDITTDEHQPVYATSEKLSLNPGQSMQKSFTLPTPKPGFYRSYAYMEFDGGKTKPIHTIFGYEPEKIKAPVDAKPDFESFWKNNLAELDAINPDYKLTPQPELSNNDYEVYIVEMASFGNERVKSYYAKPKREGKFPVSVEFQGYGSGPYPPSTNWDGFAHMLVSVRGQGLNKPGHKYGDWIVYGLESKENYYYRGAFLDLVRGIDFVCSRPEIDTSKIAAQGYSQGGAFTFIASALDKRIKAAVPGEPFLSDYSNYFKIVGWPKMSFDNYMKEHPEATWDKVFDVLSYFDIKNFAPWIKCPLWMGMAVQDETCPGRVNFAAYNHVSSPKKWTAFPTEGHVWIPGFHQGWIDFFKESMKLK